MEVKYNISYLNKILTKGYGAEETQDIIETYFKKTMHTVEVLMNQLNMMYFLEKIKLMFIDEEPTMSQLHKLMNRCAKLYESINCIMKAFKLIQKKELYDELIKKDPALAN